jgi:ferredoxin
LKLGSELKMGRKVIIDQEECIGCGSCQDICPEVFKLNEGIEKAEVIRPEGGPEDRIEEAMGECPMSCIFWD